jgi:hypothetical protein
VLGDRFHLRFGIRLQESPAHGFFDFARRPLEFVGMELPRIILDAVDFLMVIGAPEIGILACWPIACFLAYMLIFPGGMDDSVLLGKAAAPSPGVA